MNISNTKLKRGTVDDYTPEQIAEIRVTKDVLYEAERSLRLQNEIWKLMLAEAQGPNNSTFKAYERVKRMKWQRRESRIALRLARAAYTYAVNNPPAIKASDAIIAKAIRDHLRRPSLMESLLEPIKDYASMDTEFTKQRVRKE